jgi:four helix bundle protein
MQSFRNLKVWEKAHAVTLEVYRSSKLFPRDEMYGLTSQMRRASASIGRISPKGPVAKEIASSADFCRLLSDQPANLSITCYWRTIWSC